MASEYKLKGLFEIVCILNKKEERSHLVLSKNMAAKHIKHHQQKYKLIFIDLQTFTFNYEANALSGIGGKKLFLSSILINPLLRLSL